MIYSMYGISKDPPICNVISVVDQGNECLSLAAALLGSDLAVVLNVDVVVGRKGVDLVLGELSAMSCQSSLVHRQVDQVEYAYVKPLISLNSVVILPPCSVTCFLALQ